MKAASTAQNPKTARTPRRPASRNSSIGTRSAIMAAATAEFADKGYDGARVDEIAMNAGVNKNLIYHHYMSKDGLFTAVLENTYEAIRKRQRDLEIRDADPVAGMRKLVIFTGRIWIQLPAFQRLLHSENLHQGVHVRQSPKVRQIYNPLLATIQDLLDRGGRSGRFRKNIDPIDLYISISALTQSLLGTAPAPHSHEAAHAADQRQGRALHPDALARMGLRPSLRR